jgi:hypothetical protein
MHVPVCACVKTCAASTTIAMRLVHARVNTKNKTRARALKKK